MKICPICQKQFDSDNTRRKYCSPKCVRVNYMDKKGKITQAAYYLLNKDTIKSQNKTADRPKNRKLQERYGIDLTQYHNMALDQDNKCKICQKELKLNVDHCHKTGKVRGLLCNGCNRGIGFFSDDPVVIQSAALYLRNNDEN